ncbi:MAG: hypothetical protein M4579_004420 [Chaenotheca gracillima]|nr:MAG: hypothetical protein M4579_004420 [Chaenotheca gracillima]
MSGLSGPDSPRGGKRPRKSWSSISGRIFANSEPRSAGRDRSVLIDEYNTLAKEVGLPPLPPSFESAIASEQLRHEALAAAAATPSKSAASKNWLARKFMRKTTTTRSPETSDSEKSVSRRVSFGDVGLLARRRDSLKDQDLDDVARLGGLSVFVLPQEFSPCPLTVPTCISATATYLAQHGPSTAGIFRIPGSVTIINALYDHYGHLYDDAEKDSLLIQQTVGSGTLPLQIPYCIHDVASAFKKFLSGVPGGILGSVELFRVLRDIREHLFNPSRKTDAQYHHFRARLMALAIASSGAEIRISLICAALGLACLVGQRGETIRLGKPELKPPGGSDMMNYQGLSVVFAPLLLGSLTDMITTDSEETSKGKPQETPITPPKQRKKLKHRDAPSKKTVLDSNFAQHLERAKICFEIAQMLIENWPEIVKNLRDLCVLTDSRTSELPKYQPQRSKSLKTLRPSGESSKHSHKSSLESAIHVRKQRSRDLSNRTTSFSVRQVPSEPQMGISGLLPEDGEPIPKPIKDAGSEKQSADKGTSGSDVNNGDVSVSAVGKSQDIAEGSSRARSGSLPPPLANPPPTQCISSEEPRPVRAKQSGDQSSNSNRRGHRRTKTSPEALRVLVDLPNEQKPNGVFEQEGGHGASILAKQSSAEQENPALGTAALRSNFIERFRERPLHERSEHAMTSQRQSANKMMSQHEEHSKAVHMDKTPSSFSRIRHTFEISPSRTPEGLENTGLSSPTKQERRRLFSKTPHRRFNSSPTNVLKPDPVTVSEIRVLTSASPNRQHVPIPPANSPVSDRHYRPKISPSRRFFNADQYSPGRVDPEIRSKPSTGVLGNTALYAEIRRLQRQLDVQTEELRQAHHELNTMHRFRDSSTANEQLREGLKDGRMWRNRAEWAEKRLMMQQDVEKVGKRTALQYGKVVAYENSNGKDYEKGSTVA